MPEPTPEQMAEYRDWLLSRPPNVRAVMDRFPPACYVRATRPLLIPTLEEEGMVAGYEEYPDGRVTVNVEVNRPESPVPLQGECDPDWLVAVDSDEQFALYRQATA